MIMMRSTVKVPLLSGGKYVPKFPGYEPTNTGNQDSDEANHIAWQDAIDDWATYFMALLVPWELFVPGMVQETNAPPLLDFNFRGFLQWVEQTPVEQTPENDVHQGRLRYLDNCVVASQKKKHHEKAIGLFRDQSADTKEVYLQRQAEGARGGHNIAGEQDDGSPHTYGHQNDTDADSIRRQIDDIRGLAEGIEFAPSSIGNTFYKCIFLHMHNTL